MAIEIARPFVVGPPEIVIAVPSGTHMAGEVAFERERLTAWFGG